MFLTLLGIEMQIDDMFKAYINRIKNLLVLTCLTLQDNIYNNGHTLQNQFDMVAPLDTRNMPYHTKNKLFRYLDNEIYVFTIPEQRLVCLLTIPQIG